MDPNSIVVGGIAASFFVASATSSILGALTQHIYCSLHNLFTYIFKEIILVHCTVLLLRKLQKKCQLNFENTLLIMIFKL